MERKEYGTTRRFLSTLVICNVIFVCCALPSDLHAQPSLWMKKHETVATHDIMFFDPSAGFDIFDVFDVFDAGRIQPEHWLAPDASSLIGPIYLNDSRGKVSVISQVTPDLVAKMFPGAPRGNIERYLPMIRKALAERGLVDKMMVLMAMATIRVETSRFDPISEVPSALNTQAPGPPFNRYDWRQDLGNLGPPDGAMFKGRGFIQLTGRKNYGFYGALLGHNLIGNPELANSPQPAAQILAAYLKENEAAIRGALAAGDLATARRIVNGGINGLDRFTAAFLFGNQLIRDYGGSIAFSTNLPEK